MLELILHPPTRYHWKRYSTLGQFRLTSTRSPWPEKLSASVLTSNFQVTELFRLQRFSDYRGLQITGAFQVKKETYARQCTVHAWNWTKSQWKPVVFILVGFMPHVPDWVIIILNLRQTCKVQGWVTILARSYFMLCYHKRRRPQDPKQQV